MKRQQTVQLANNLSIETTEDNYQPEVVDHSLMVSDDISSQYEVIKPSEMTANSHAVSVFGCTVSFNNPLKYIQKTFGKPVMERTGTVELNVQQPTPDIPQTFEEREDISTYYNCYISLDICMVFGVMQLYRKRGLYYLNYIPTETVNHPTGLFNLINARSFVGDLEAYRYTVCVSTLDDFRLFEDENETATYSLKFGKNATNEIFPTFKFIGDRAKTEVEHLINDLKSVETLKVVQDAKNGTKFHLYHVNMERVKSVMLGTETPWDKMNRPDLVRQRTSLVITNHIEGMNALSMKVINSLMDKDGRISDENMDVIRRTLYYRSCEQDARELAWSLCLGFLDYKKTRVERKEEEEKNLKMYEKMKSVWENVIPEQKENWKMYKQIEVQIDKDVRRTDRTDSKFKTLGCQNLVILKNVLMTYSFYNMRLNYGQGMNDIAAGLMDVATNENTLFWLLKLVMDFLQPFYFCGNDVIMKALKKNDSILRFASPQLSDYLQQKDISYFFCYKWNALLFKRFFKTEDLIRIWDAVFAFPTKKMFYFITVAILKEYTDLIIAKQLSFDELMIFIQTLTERIPIGVIYDADVLYQEFKMTADKELVRFVYETFNYKPVF
ncbi:hypothetical protein EIN_391440 [Entamoeba invadens IP1]|uniref:Rab-GAP TBC domain-containing protein n=1 Tax=Entamoeba invadens IP1 TaxID=370355 RepID=A0A0A1U5B7_ENTIV|nr:hypothetical protein EIN_391440 [Entamoeba invadens IP1]ELP89489.1 hypothetical protein EIN_391440 [Entamoeba invadens IP1]|eukprot:XP_004256260.1 hypothetical protein EIN_391440 [Entamoeba invadens IP1]